MPFLLETTDKSGRKIHLTTERWTHINTEHPEISAYFNDFEEVLKNPTKIITYFYDDNIRYFYKYFKQRKSSSKFLLLIVKYLNGNGFIISGYFVNRIL